MVRKEHGHYLEEVVYDGGELLNSKARFRLNRRGDGPSR